MLLFREIWRITTWRVYKLYIFLKIISLKKYFTERTAWTVQETCIQGIYHKTSRMMKKNKLIIKPLSRSRRSQFIQIMFKMKEIKMTLLCWKQFYLSSFHHLKRFLQYACQVTIFIILCTGCPKINTPKI